MKLIFSAISCLCFSGCVGTQGPPLTEEVAGKLEMVMAEGDKITARTSAGTIEIVAGKGLDRTYTWDGASRSATLWPRTERWYGSMGAYFPGPGRHWKSHHGITRGVLQEGRQHFNRRDEAMGWIKKQSGYYATVYTGNGLVVSFDKVPGREQLNVEVCQILIDGKMPVDLPGAKDDGVDFQRAGRR